LPEGLLVAGVPTLDAVEHMLQWHELTLRKITNLFNFGNWRGDLLGAMQARIKFVGDEQTWSDNQGQVVQPTRKTIAGIKVTLAHMLSAALVRDGDLVYSEESGAIKRAPPRFGASFCDAAVC
jgi:hypothetical protein